MADGHGRPFIGVGQSVIAAVSLTLLSAWLSADPATPAAGPLPDTFIAKVAATPHFFQRDPRWGLQIAGENYCVPVAVSNALVYFAGNGFPRLLPDESDKELAQVEIIRTLASAPYMAMHEDTGTSVSGALAGLRKYIREHGYTCTRLEYAGWRSLTADQRQAQVASEPDLNWLKAAIAAPNGAVFLEIGHYNHGTAANEWKRVSGHTMLAIGYGTDGMQEDPQIFLVDNSSMRPRVWTGPMQANGVRPSRPLLLAEQSITLRRAGPIRVIPPPRAGKPQNLPDSYCVVGPAIPSREFDAQFLDGAIVVMIGK